MEKWKKIEEQIKFETQFVEKTKIQETKPVKQNKNSKTARALK